MPFTWDTTLNQWVVAKLPEEYGGSDYLKQPRGIDLPPEIWQSQAGAAEKTSSPTYPSGKRPALKRYQIVMSDGFDGNLGIIDHFRREARDRDSDLLAEYNAHGYMVTRDPFAEAVQRTGDRHRHSYHDVHHFLAGKRGLFHQWNKDTNEYAVALYTEEALSYFWHKVRPFLLDDGCMVVPARMQEFDIPWNGEIPPYSGTDDCVSSPVVFDLGLDEWEDALTPEQLALWEAVK